MILRCLIIIIISVLMVVPLESYALSPLYSFRYLYEQQTNVSPSPSPSDGVNGASSSGSNFQQSCNTASRSCELKSITACLTRSQSGPYEEVWLLVQNNGENPLHVKIMILPTNNTIKDIDLQSHHMEKIIMSANVDLSSAISLNTSDGECVIHAVAPPPENYYSSYGTYINPINGAYMVFSLLIVGGILTFVKLRIRNRHLEGVPYHELEMGDSKGLNVEENDKENWDQVWDDEWGDEKPVKSNGERCVIVEQANGLTTKLPNSNGKRKEWDD